MFAGAFLTLAASTAGAQSLTGAIAGNVKDPQGASVPGASVTLLGRTRPATTTTDPGGEYRFPAIEPGTYSLHVEMRGFKPQQRDTIGIHVGTQLTIDFSLSVAGLTESVDVSGQPVVDVSSPAIVNGLSQDILFNVPLDRAAIDLLNATPGVDGHSAFGGGALSNNAMLLDGVDSRDPRLGQPGVVFNYNIVEEVQIQGLGAPAEYGGFTGAIVNTITRSGGNDLRGLFEARYSSTGLSFNNVDAEIATANPALVDPASTRKLLDVTAQISGPIRRDKLFFFLNLQRYELDRDPSGGRSVEDETTPRLNGKLTWQPGPDDHLTAMFQFDDSHAAGLLPVDHARQYSQYARYLGDELTETSARRQRVWNAQWRHVFGSHAFAEAKYMGFWTSEERNPQVLKSTHVEDASRHGLVSVSAGRIYQLDAGRHQVNLSLSRHLEAFGYHDLKFGLEIERGRRHNRVELINGIYYRDVDGQPVEAIGSSEDALVRTEREGVYVQDAWQPNQRITLSSGLRFDVIRGTHPDFGTIFQTRNLAPRIGIAFDVGGDRRSVLKATYGRYYEAALGSLFDAAVPGRSDEVHYSVPDLVEVGRFPVPVTTVAPGIRQPRVDQTTIAFERALGNDTRLSLSALHRVNQDLIEPVYPTARWYNDSAISLLTGRPITFLGPAGLHDFSQKIINPDGYVYRDPEGGALRGVHAYRKYRALMVVLSRRLSQRWQAQASFVLSRALGSVDNIQSQSIGQSYTFLSASQATTFPAGRLTNDPRHEVKLLASYQVPGPDLVLSGYFRSIGGNAYTPVQDVGLRFPIRIEARGSRHTPTVTLLDLRLEKVFRFRQRKDRVGLYADVFNVFNAAPVLEVQAEVPNIDLPGIATPVPFGAPLAIAPARQGILGARWSF